MAESIKMDTPNLLRRTLVTVGAMVGACVVVVGTLTLVVLGIVDHAVGSKADADTKPAATVSAPAPKK
jgi:hypothetical protein